MPNSSYKQFFQKSSLALVHSLNVQTVLFQTMQFSISTQFQCQKTVPFQTIKFSISTLFSSIWPIERTLSGATTLGQSGPGSDGNVGVLRFLQNSSISRAPPSDCLVSCPGGSLGVLILCRDADGGILQLQLTGQVQIVINRR